MQAAWSILKEKARRGLLAQERLTKARTTGTTSIASVAAQHFTMVELVETTGQKIKERAKARAKAIGKKDGWKENHSHIARKMKSMLMGGGRQQTIRRLGKQKKQ